VAALEDAPIVVVSDELSREAYGVFGIVVDAASQEAVLSKLHAAVHSRAPFLWSTPNLNFLINSGSDSILRKSLLASELCPADGAPVAWLARLAGAPIRARIPGADIFDALKAKREDRAPLKVFLFGGPEGAAEKARDAINRQHGGMVCTGALQPGFGDVEEMSGDDTIAAVNASEADLLAVALGAQKGQAWLLRNHERLAIPVRAHLGATINFEAGTVKRAPAWLGRCGLEWFWRVKEEPALWRRYWRDGCALLKLLVTRALPLMVATAWCRATSRSRDLEIDADDAPTSVVLRLKGAATGAHVDAAIAAFRSAAGLNKAVVIDMSEVAVIDSRFTGLLLMLRKTLGKRSLLLINAPPRVAKLLHLNGFGFLLSSASE
jgi:N-acetylglucosaminyldiphosphoundecaprenol N-acetyl-beta-D-mannosaminyltransferase